MENSKNQDSRYARNLIEATLDPMIIIDVNGKIIDVNEAMEKATDKVREKLIGTGFSTYFVEEEKAQEAYRDVFKRGFILNFPLTIIDGVTTDVLVNGSVFKSEQGKILGAVVVARDITTLKKIEKELIEAKVFAELTTEIAKEERSKAENAMQAKQHFLSNMSHEIRTPLNAIIGFTKVISKTSLSEKQQEYVSAIKTSGDTLIVLINDILDLAKVDAGKMTFEQEPFELAVSISAMLHLFDTKIQEKNLLLVTEYDNRIPHLLLGDPVRLNQIILNLVSNAVKFTLKGKIVVSVCLLNEDAKTAYIELAVKDTGIGIAENKIATIFENFQQATSGTSRLYGGTGLGLAIVKQLVEMQGGNISVESDIDEGTKFSVKLSFNKTNIEPQIDQEITEIDKEVENISVLVAEDIPLNQLLMKTLLDDFGFRFDIAGNGKIAIEKLKENSYDIILMDLQMPEMNGFEATEYIRNKMNSKIPIIALTADVTTVDLAKCKSVGMDDYISKPVDERLLYDKIVGLIKRSSHQKSGKAEEKIIQGEKLKFVDLSYLTQRTKSDPKLMMEMISLYLEQTPPLISIMKQGLQDKDWNSLQGAVHKMIPSFSIMGISKDFEHIAKKVQEYANNIQEQTAGIPHLVLQLEDVCAQACKELEEEFDHIKNANLQTLKR
jgi:PAS domain S-box-containing protein